MDCASSQTSFMAAESDISDLEYFATIDLTSVVKQPDAFHLAKIV